GQEGQALLLALGFITFMGFLSVSVFTFVDTGLRGNTRLDGVRRTTYSANAALDIAINKTRYSGQGAVSNCPSAMNINSAVDNGPPTGAAAPNGVSMWILSQCFSAVPASADRDVVFTACTDASSPCSVDKVAAKTEVYYVDLPSTGFAAVTHDWSVTK